MQTILTICEAPHIIQQLVYRIAVCFVRTIQEFIVELHNPSLSVAWESL